MKGGGSKNKQLAIHDILDSDLVDVSNTVDTHDRELNYLRSCNSMHIRRSTTAALRYCGPFGKLVLRLLRGWCPGVHSDGVIFPHDNARQQETLQARKTAVNVSVGKYYVIPQTVRTSHPAI
jgi:hypothetical protein